MIAPPFFFFFQVGLVPRIRQLALEPQQFTLAVSLHEADDAARSSIMPVNRRFPIAELLDACVFYADTTGRRVTFEWALIDGVNDNSEVRFPRWWGHVMSAAVADDDGPP